MQTAGLDIKLNKTNPLENLYIDEALVFLPLEAMAIRAWLDPPSMVLGRFQDPRLEVDSAGYRADPVPVVRRFSGGGTVYHDQGVLNIALSIPTRLFSHFEPPFNKLSDRIGFLSGMLAEALPVDGFSAIVDPHGSVFIDGKKVLGCAAYVKPGRLLYHASVLWRADLGRLHRLIRWDKGSMPSTRVGSRRRPVVNLSDYWEGERKALEQILKDKVIQTFGLKNVTDVHTEAALSDWMQRDFNTLQFHSKGVDYV